MESLKFVNEPSNDHLCPICVEPLIQPFLTDCGHYLCYTCRGRLLASGRDQCPECREPNGAKDARLNKHLQRQVNSLKVRCRHHEVGCQWVGELMYLKEHLDPLLRRCGFILLVCPLGCGERVRSSAMEEHIRSNCSIVEFRLLPIEFTITDFLKMKESNTEWVSPPFYTHPHGYKVCLVVYPNGIDMGEGSHVSVFVGLLKGEHDDQLGWPLELDFAIELLNWREDKGHYEHTVTINSEYYRVTKNGIKMSPNVLLFIHRSLLSYNSSTDTEYLQNNSLRLRVNRATMHSTPFVAPAPSWLEPSKVSQSVCEFTLTEFSKRKELKNRFFSPSFYTHQNGYKMCLIVCANGEFHGKGTHVTVYVQLLAGVNDDQLQWPFTGDIILELVNWREDKGHHSKTLSIGVVSGLDKVTEGTAGMTAGLSQFISHSCLSYNCSTNTEYLHKDSLHLRVKQVVVYFTPLLLKTPSWQNPCNVISQSVCEFTLTEFSKRKQFNNIFYGPPFYQHGYKMHVEVYANGNGSSKGTHVSVYVRLMAGEYDDQLRWPFVGDIDVMLLNWRENKGHFNNTVSVNATSGLVRAVETVMGWSWGCEFISHSSLFYNPATNTGYLCDDSLRLRVNQVTLYSTCLPLEIPFWQNLHNVSRSVCEFTLNEFSKRKQFNNSFYGPSFYAYHQQGYKMCLKVCANGYSNGKSTHVSVFVNIMAGDHDDQLQWPFVGDIDIMLLNWREDRGHHKKTISINAASGLVRVLEGDYGKCWGYAQFMSHSSLRYNHYANTEYLHNDSLRLRVKQVVIYSTPLLPKTPYWQDFCNVYPSVCECTLNEFSKRKQFDNTFDSPPFYTHQHGYKMCLNIHANGYGNGKGTHVSVYVQIMAGEYDDRLRWPFVGDIDVMLINWQENQRFHKKTISVKPTSGMVRVLEGECGKSWGLHAFIPHSSLHYNHFTNTEYLQDDCLRFRVFRIVLGNNCVIM